MLSIGGDLHMKKIYTKAKDQHISINSGNMYYPGNMCYRSSGNLSVTDQIIALTGTLNCKYILCGGAGEHNMSKKLYMKYAREVILCFDNYSIIHMYVCNNSN